MGKVTIQGLRVSTIIGTLSHERIHRQQLILNISFAYDTAKAAATDDLRYSVDYSAVEKQMVEITEKSSFMLIETLAGKLGEAILKFPGVTGCTVEIIKPAASAFGAVISCFEEFFPEKK
jgi:dihydroneopterin aldolase